MRRAASILLLCALFAWFTPRAHADAIAFTNSHVVICFFGDSWNVDSSGEADNSISGFRFEAYLHAYLARKYPTNQFAFYNLSRGGGSMDDMLTNRLQRLGLPLWGWQSNNFQLIGIANMTDNGGGLTSNQMYLAMSNVFQAPAIMSGGDSTLASIPGWAASHPIQWIGLGQPVEQVNDGDGRQRDRDNATVNAGNNLAKLGIPVWPVVALGWTNDFNANGGIHVQWLPRGGHFASGGALSWFFACLHTFTAGDTNISTCTVDFNSAINAATNHCVIYNFVKTGNKLTFNRLDDRSPPVWDIPNGTITNDASGAFNLNATDANYLQFTLQVTNLPAGSYNVSIDGVLCAVLSSDTLAAGWNMITNYVSPYWTNGVEVLGRVRDVEGVNRVTLVPIGGQGLQGVGGTLQNNWVAGDRGDQLIADANAVVSGVNTNSANSFAAVNAAAQPTVHTFTLELITPRFVPAVVQTEKPLWFAWNPGGYEQFLVVTSDTIERPLQAWDWFAVRNTNTFSVVPDRAHQYFAVAGIDACGHWDWCVSAPPMNSQPSTQN